MVPWLTEHEKRDFSIPEKKPFQILILFDMFILYMYRQNKSVFVLITNIISHVAGENNHIQSPVLIKTRPYILSHVITISYRSH